MKQTLVDTVLCALIGLFIVVFGSAWNAYSDAPNRTAVVLLAVLTLLGALGCYWGVRLFAALLRHLEGGPRHP